MPTTNKLESGKLWPDALFLLSALGLAALSVIAIIKFEERQTDRIKAVEAKASAQLPFDAVFMADSITRHTTQLQALQKQTERNRREVAELTRRLDNVEAIQASRGHRIETLENQMQNLPPTEYRWRWPGVRK